MMEISILFEDSDIVVIAKPSGVVTNTAASVKEPSLQDWFQEYLAKQGSDPTEGSDWQTCIPEDFSDEYGSPQEIFTERKGMVHRLDKETSGVMIFAKNPGSLVSLLTQFRLRQTQKEYLALVHGAFRVEKGTISAPLARARVDRRRFAVDIEGRPAETLYSVEKVFAGFSAEEVKTLPVETQKVLKESARLYEQGFSLVRCWPKTGRTHQIRVHMAHEQHPLVGDATYMGKKRVNADAVWCARHFLHAEALEVMHPRTKEKMRFVAPLPSDLQGALNILQEKK